MEVRNLFFALTGTFLVYAVPMLTVFGQNGDDLRVVQTQITSAIERQGTMKVDNGFKSGWKIRFKECLCEYEKYQTFKSGTNYTRIDWSYTFDLKDIKSAEYIDYDNDAIILTGADGKEAIHTVQVKTFRDYNTTHERFDESTVYIDVRNRSAVEGLLDKFRKAIRICNQ